MFYRGVQSGVTSLDPSEKRRRLVKQRSETPSSLSGEAIRFHRQVAIGNEAQGSELGARMSNG
jgi:hypothetical protein